MRSSAAGRWPRYAATTRIAPSPCSTARAFPCSCTAGCCGQAEARQRSPGCCPGPASTRPSRPSRPTSRRRSWTSSRRRRGEGAGGARRRLGSEGGMGGRAGSDEGASDEGRRCLKSAPQASERYRMSRTGRRPGAPDTRDAILRVARRRFATRGYDATSLRGIATEAKVDPALVIHYFGTKEALFIAATGLPARLPELFAGLPLRDRVRALVLGYLQLVDSDQSRNAFLALVRSAVSNQKAATMLREFLTSELLPVIGRPTGQPDAQLRASLVAAQLIGIAALRHVIRVEPLVKASPDQIVALVTPAVEQYLR